MTIDNIKHMYIASTAKHDATVTFISKRDDPDLYGEADETTYLPMYITASDGTIMFVEVEIGNNGNDGSVDQHWEVLDNGDIAYEGSNVTSDNKDIETAVIEVLSKIISNI